MRTVPALVACLLLLLGSCGSLTYDLSNVPVPVSVQPAGTGAVTEPLRIEQKSVLWVHGLFGASQPDIGELVRDAAQGADGIANFRVRQSASFHDWLITHLTLTLVRLKTVVIEGEVVRTAAR